MTQRVRALVDGARLEVRADPAILGGDPVPGRGKRLYIWYSLAGQVDMKLAGDTRVIRIGFD